MALIASTTLCAGIALSVIVVLTFLDVSLSFHATPLGQSGGVQPHFNVRFTQGQLRVLPPPPAAVAQSRDGTGSREIRMTLWPVAVILCCAGGALQWRVGVARKRPQTGRTAAGTRLVRSVGRLAIALSLLGLAILAATWPLGRANLHSSLLLSFPRSFYNLEGAPTRVNLGQSYDDVCLEIATSALAASRAGRQQNVARREVHFFDSRVVLRRDPSGIETVFLVFGKEWLAVLFLSVAPAVALASVTLRRLRRSRGGPPCCVRCGYNLTGNVSGICPECGIAPGGVTPTAMDERTARRGADV
ncbi:MAG: hypothetical protein CHACPFDD_00213 [Phycisphaerae bacterium]|nr:hypothetical protein [Phycisphaerae bacterium]